MWAQALNVALGLWLMAAPAALDYGRPASVNDRVIGPIVASIAMVSIAQVLRPMRHLNLPLGAWLVVAPLALHSPGPGAVNSIACGIAIALLSRARGRITRPFGGGWSVLWRRPGAESAS